MFLTRLNGWVFVYQLSECEFESQNNMMEKTDKHENEEDYLPVKTYN